MLVEVKGVLSRVGDTLSCPANGPWSLPEAPDPPVHVRKGDTNPIGQVAGGTFNLKKLAEQTGIDNPFVSGLVLVVPPARRTITLAKSGLPPGMDIQVGTMNNLRRWLHTAHRRKAPSWSAEQTHALIRALDFRHAVTLADLISQGFVSSAPPVAATEPMCPIAMRRPVDMSWLDSEPPLTSPTPVASPRPRTPRPPMEDDFPEGGRATAITVHSRPARSCSGELFRPHTGYECPRHPPCGSADGEADRGG